MAEGTGNKPPAFPHDADWFRSADPPNNPAGDVDGRLQQSTAAPFPLRKEVCRESAVAGICGFLLALLVKRAGS
jgi:hypothetical protein